MFFDGDLHLGIATALRESKSVICFIRDDSEQSTLWEHVYFKDEQIKTALGARAVTLRIDANSQEAAYLSAYYAVPVVPALMIIQNGQLRLDIRAGETKDSFKAALLKTLIDTSSYNGSLLSLMPVPVNSEAQTLLADSHRANVLPPTPRETASSAPQGLNQSIVSSGVAASTQPAPVDTPAPDTATSSPTNLSNTRTSQTVQHLLADQRRRLEIDKEKKEAAAKTERKSQAHMMQISMAADPSSAKAKQATYAQQQRKRQHEARQERERILKQIEHDKAERKEKEEQRRALAKAEAEAEGQDGTGGLIDQQLANEINLRGRTTKTGECVIQVRMFDGSTIRNRFTSDQTLRTEVRLWVDKERRDGDLPYTFKQILAPLPNRTLSISEEDETLHSLNLPPSATLIMVPVQNYTAAYSESHGIVSRGASIGYNILLAGAGLVSGAVGKLLGFGQTRTPNQESTTQIGTPQSTDDMTTREAAAGIRVRTLHDQRDSQEHHQFYNGNQLNFEPRRDSGDKED